MTDVDVVIVGAGVVGSSIAARLSRERYSVVVLERRHDAGDETSKSNSGIASVGWALEPGTLEADLVTRSAARWPELCDQLQVPFRRCGGLVLVRSEAELAELPAKVARAVSLGVAARAIDQAELRRIAPYVDESILGAIDLPDEAVIDSPRLVLAYAELAAQNGVQFHLGEPLVGARRQGSRVIEVSTPRRTLRTRFVVNAAGLGADAVSRALGCEEFDVIPRRGEWLLVDREHARTVDRVLSLFPTKETHGVMVIPTPHGQMLLGPTAEDIEDKLDRSTHEDALADVFAECRALVPSLRREHVIKTFAGLRTHSVPTYRVGPSEIAENVIQVAGIRSTGVSSSPAMGDHVRDLLAAAGLPERLDATSSPNLPRRLRLQDGFDCDALADDPLGRTVVCACEKVTAREIHDALSSALPARSIQAVARRTHATWGRCQGSACLSGVSFITSLYLGPEAAWETPYGEPPSTLGVGETRRG